MKMYLHVILAGFLILWGGVANAINIDFTAMDLADVNPGEDLWQYSYTLSDHTFAADTGFIIYFDLGLYDLLDPAPPAPNSDWDVITWNPDPSLPDDGAYDAYALVDNASLADAFTVTFVWLGGNSGPGSQYFELYNGLTWTVLESGSTHPSAASVPEPSTMILFGTGLAGFIGTAIRKRFKKT